MNACCVWLQIHASLLFILIIPLQLLYNFHTIMASSSAAQYAGIILIAVKVKFLQ